SHGCVRLDPANAARLFSLVKEEGMAHTKIEITGDVKIALATMKPARGRRVASRRPPVRGREQDLGVIYSQTAAYGEPTGQHPRYGAYFPEYGGYADPRREDQAFRRPTYNHPVWNW
ncbi:MAG: hypothetical protein ACRELF_21850, partial [Gemmataceae bacterium]